MITNEMMCDIFYLKIIYLKMIVNPLFYSKIYNLYCHLMSIVEVYESDFIPATKFRLVSLMLLKG